MKKITLPTAAAVLAAIAALVVIGPNHRETAADKEARCHKTIVTINKAIGQYNEDKGFYPKALSHVTESIMYFQDGPPVCPVHGTDYPETLATNNLVNSTDHDRHPPTVTAEETPAEQAENNEPAAAEAQQPDEYRLTKEQKSELSEYRRLVAQVLKKAANADGTPEVFSPEEQDKLCHSLIIPLFRDSYPRTKGYSISLTVHKPRWYRERPRVLLHLGPKSTRHIELPALLEYIYPETDGITARIALWKDSNGSYNPVAPTKEATPDISSGGG